MANQTISNMEQAEAALLPYVPLVAQLTGKDTVFDRIDPLMDALGNPEKQLKTIHIAGTSGKTSTAYFTAALLQTTGKTIGLTVSPHVDSVRERVQINGEPLSEALFCSELEEFLKVVDRVPKKPSYFELLYAFSLWEFVRRKVDCAVIETGMGGLYDATNVVTRADKVCVITDIGYDHMHILGNTLPEIAAQKIGIVHEGNQTIMYEQGEEVMAVMRAWTKKHSAPLLETSEEKECFDYGGDLSMLPAYQQRNWLLARRAFELVSERDGLSKGQKELIDATKAVQVPGRMDSRTWNGKTLIMDGAHNEQKMAAFITSFQQRYPRIRPAVLMSLKQGKEYTSVAPLIARFADRVIVTAFKTTQDLPAQAIDPKQLAEALIESGVKDVTVQPDQRAALQLLADGPEPVVVITGSFYLLSQLRSTLL